MMKHEFEALAGYEVSYEDYTKIIEPMYMATDLPKDEFVKTLSKKRFALKPLKTIVKEMRDCAESLKETCTHYTDYETKDRLEALIKEYRNRKYGSAEVATYGISEDMLWSCFYPVSVEIYSPKTNKTFESIDLRK